MTEDMRFFEVGVEEELLNRLDFIPNDFEGYYYNDICDFVNQLLNILIAEGCTKLVKKLSFQKLSNIRTYVEGFGEDIANLFLDQLLTLLDEISLDIQFIRYLQEESINDELSQEVCETRFLVVKNVYYLIMPVTYVKRGHFN